MIFYKPSDKSNLFSILHGSDADDRVCCIYPEHCIKTRCHHLPSFTPSRPTAVNQSIHSFMLLQESFSSGYDSYTDFPYGRVGICLKSNWVMTLQGWLETDSCFSETSDVLVTERCFYAAYKGSYNERKRADWEHGRFLKESQTVVLRAELDW